VSMAHPYALLAIFGAWAIVSVVVALIAARGSPAVSLALFGAVLGGAVAFLFANAHRPAGVPVTTAIGASLALVACGLVGLLTTRARPSEPLLRGAVVVLVAAPVAAVPLTFLLQLACPLYVTGTHAGFCSYGDLDQLGGWIPDVILAFLFDAIFVAGLLRVSGWQARREEIASPASTISRV
jgi:hypothetical protein